MLFTFEVSHREISWLKSYLSLNSSSMLVTSDTSQSGMSVAHAAPQSAPPAEQQFSPEGTAARQSSTACLRAAEVLNGLGTELMHPMDAPTSHAPGGPSYIPSEVSYVPVHTSASKSSYPQLV